MATDDKTEQPEKKEEETVVAEDGAAAQPDAANKEDGAGGGGDDAKDAKTVATASAAAAPRPTVHKADFDKDIVYLYQFSRTPLLPSLSPYCLKVETWLRLSGIKYENVDHKMKFRSKKGQLPFVELNGEEIADSTFILRELGQRYGIDLDASLSDDQKNVSHAMITMIENHLCWVYVWWRTKFPDLMLKGYKVNLQHVLNSKFPSSILNIVFKFTYCRRGAKKVKAHGLGVHKPEEIYEFGQRDLQVLSDILADKPFFFGDEPATLDVVAFANLAQIHFVDKEVSYPLRDWMEEHCSNLIGHINRMKERCFPDWEEMSATLDLNTHLPKPPPEEKKDEEKGKESEKEKGEDEKEKEGEKIEGDEKKDGEGEKENKDVNQKEN